MAPGKKKGFKKNSKTQNLSTFLQDGQASAPGYTERVMDWAETMEIEERNYDAVKVILPNAPKSARGIDFDIDKVPATPPFTAYVGNLPYDASEEDICVFFQKLKLEVTSVRIPKENGDHGRMRGFGYAEFPDRKSLIDALTLNNETMKKRPVKVSLATEHGENERSSGRSGDGRADRTAGDWRSTAKEEAYTYRKESYGFDKESSSSREFGDRGGFEKRERFGDRDGGFDGGFDKRGGGGGRRDFGRTGFQDNYDRSRSGFEDWDKRRDFGRRDEEDSDRRGGDSYRREGNSFRRTGDSDFRRGGDSDFRRGGDSEFRRGGDDSRRGGDDFRRGGDDFKRGGDDFKRGGDDFRRGGDDFKRGGDDFKRGGDDFKRGGDDFKRADGPVERPRLQLTPRTVPVEGSASSTASSAIFGGAKPVDTAAKEREIEQRMAKERESKSALEKKEEPMRRVSTSSAPRSRRSSEGGSGPNQKSSCSEDDAVAPYKAPTKQPKQRQNSVGSTGSDQENNRDSRSAVKRQDKYRNDSGSRTGRNHSSGSGSGHANGDINRRPKDKQPTLKIANPEPVVYTTSNKFSYLPDGEDEGNVSN